jgi:hypothetical protein
MHRKSGAPGNEARDWALVRFAGGSHGGGFYGATATLAMQASRTAVPITAATTTATTTVPPDIDWYRREPRDYVEPDPRRCRKSSPRA